jgi:hypothetical protein
VCPDPFTIHRLPRRDARPGADDPHADLAALHETLEVVAQAARHHGGRMGATPLAPLQRVHRALETLQRFTLTESVAAAAADIEHDILFDLEQLAWLHASPSERALTVTERAALERAQGAVHKLMWVLLREQAARRAARRAGRP